MRRTLLLPAALAGVAIAGLAGLAGLVMAATGSRPIELPPLRPATLSAHAAQSVTLSVARAGSRLVAVGERGLVLLSDDGGAQWRQVAVPTSVTLAAVKFTTPRAGWAVGHYGVVLATRDGGLSWQLQFDGVRAAALAQEAALARQAALAASTASAAAPAVPAAPTEATRAAKAVTEAARLVADGPDKPFLDLHFTDERHGFIVGAYNLLFETDDGGVTWRPRLDALDNPKGNHLYAITGSGAVLYIAGEQGVLFRSDDGGRSFTRLASPYAGSWFALALMPDGGVVAGGLRGNAFHSADQGASWQRVAGLPPVAVLSLAVAPDHTLWLGNQAGQLFRSHDSGQNFAPVAAPPDRPPPPLTQLLPVEQGLVLSSLRGMARVPFNEAR
jgi:photosystem II stability/assembly factor-like uncharacterized protein